MYDAGIESTDSQELANFAYRLPTSCGQRKWSDFWETKSIKLSEPN